MMGRLNRDRGQPMRRSRRSLGSAWQSSTALRLLRPVVRLPLQQNLPIAVIAIGSICGVARSNHLDGVEPVRARTITGQHTSIVPDMKSSTNADVRPRCARLISWTRRSN